MASALRLLISAAQDIGARQDQQDAVNATLPDRREELGAICVLSDGMGGLKNGMEASTAIVNAMVRTFQQSSCRESMERILLRGCYEAQRAVKRLQEQSDERCGATLVAAIVREGRCSFLSVGDSRIYLYRRGALIQLTRSHNKGSLTEVRIGLGHLPEEARTDKGRNGLTSYIGIDSLTMVDRSSHSFEVGPGDRIVLASDGVFGTLTEEELEQELMLPEEQAANAIIDRVMAKGRPNQDNCTVAIMDFSQAL
ncbi:MAG: PP2C family protein-serine/threonine phosphatase [Aristaeellaceae bacterium]